MDVELAADRADLRYGRRPRDRFDPLGRLNGWREAILVCEALAQMTARFMLPAARAVAIAAAVVACDGDTSSGSGAAGTSSDDASIGEGGRDGGFAGSAGAAPDSSGGATGFDAALDGSAGAEADASAEGGDGSADSPGAAGSQNVPCPHVNLGSIVPTTYQGDTSSLVNIAESQRLNWRTAPDDTLLFTAPEHARYRITMTEPSSNGGCGASIQESTWLQTPQYYDTGWCPDLGQVATLDGYFADNTPAGFEIAQGQEIMIWVSCTYWSDVQSGPYTLTIEKL